MVVERLKSCDNIVALAQELGLHRRLLYRWRDQLEPVEHGEPAPSTPEMRQQVRQLKRLLAEKAMEVDFFQRCLAKSRGARRQRSSSSGEQTSTTKSGK
jgi:transposase-like protein